MSEQTDSIQKRVNDLCNSFLIQGIKITSRLILSEMPDIKSTSTVHKYLNVWKEATKQNQDALFDQLGFSQEFTQSFAKEITRFGLEEKKRHEDVSLEAIEQRDEMLKGLERAERERDEQIKIVAVQSAELTELKGEISALLKENKTNIESEKKANEATTKELRSQLDELSIDNKKLLQSNESLRTELAKAELKIENNKEYVNEIKSQISLVTEQNEQLNSEVIKLSNKGAGLDAELSGNQKLINVLQSQDEQYKNQITQLREQNSELRAELKEGKNAMALLNEKLSSNEEKLKSHANTIASYEGILKGNNNVFKDKTNSEQTT